MQLIICLDFIGCMCYEARPIAGWLARLSVAGTSRLVICSQKLKEKQRGT